MADSLSTIVPESQPVFTLLMAVTIPQSLQLKDVLDEIGKDAVLQALKRRVLEGKELKVGIRWSKTSYYIKVAWSFPLTRVLFR